MSGVAIIRAKLAAHAPLTALVPVAKIVAGELPINTAPPAITIKQISSTARNQVDMSTAGRMHTDRVSVEVLVKTTEATPAGGGYPSLQTILPLVLAACPNTRGTVAGFKCDSIMPDIEGPDVSDAELGLQSRSRDFIVTWVQA
jgi:hypothetical protein